MNQICCKLAQVVHGQEGNEMINFWDHEVSIRGFVLRIVANTPLISYRFPDVGADLR